MPGLIFKGDPIKSFGEFLPSLLVERIEVNDDSLDIKVAIFIPATDESEAKEIFNNLINSAEIKFYYGLTADSAQIEDITNKESILSGNWTEIGSWSDTPEEYIYDTSGDKIFKFAKTVEGISYGSSDTLALFCFSSIIDENNLEDLSNYSATFLNFLDKQISDITYESIFKEGELDFAPRSIYLDSNNVQYEDTPISSLGGKLYKTDKITFEQIIDTFENILEAYESQRDGDTNLDSTIDSVAYVLGTHNRDSQLLNELYKLLENWPSRVASTPVGKMYNEYSESLAAVNRKVKTDDEVREVLAQNHKLIDQRESTGESNNDNLPGLSSEYSFDPTRGATSYIYPNFYVSRQTYSAVQDGPERCMNWGFFFFDFEKAVRTKTTLSEIIDISKLEYWFGKELTNSGINIKSVALSRSGTNSSFVYSFAFFAPGQVMKMKMTMDYDQSGTSFPDGQISIEKIETDNSFLEVGDNPPSGVSKYSHLVPRSFNVASPNGMSEYRLMCFYFQDYFIGDSNVESQEELGESPHTYEWYTAEIILDDTSGKIVSALDDAMSGIKGIKSEFEEYYTDASHNCDYNNETESFSDQFVEFQTEKYEDNPHLAPWVRAATIYYLYLDLLEDRFQGSQSDLVDTIGQTIVLISPKTGTFLQLEALKNKLEELYNFYFEGDSAKLYELTTGDVEISFRTQSDLLGDIHVDVEVDFGEEEIEDTEYTYKKYKWQKEQEETRDSTKTPTRWRAIIFDKWRDVLSYCPTCKGSEMTPEEATVVSNEGTDEAASIYKDYLLEWDTVFALVKKDHLKLGWKGYYKAIHKQLKYHERESDEAEAVVKNFAQWAWGSSTARGTHKDDGFDWKAEIKAEFGLTTTESGQRMTAFELQEQADEDRGI